MTTNSDESIQSPMNVGVIGVGSMGRHHARVYSELRGANLVGVTDEDRDAAREVAEDYGTEALDFNVLVDQAEAVSIAVPTAYHYDIAKQSLERGKHILVEKPFVEEIEKGEELVALADRKELTIQVGHIERFNPAIRELDNVIGDEEILAIDVNRLGPPRDRTIDDSVVLDLMVHDIDIIRSLIGQNPNEIQASGTLDNRYATATLSYDNGPVVSLTASRITQRKVRNMQITTSDRFICVDFTDKSIEIYRQSVPKYFEEEGDIRYHHEGIIERPMVPNGEPLRLEIKAFLNAISIGEEPIVTARDGIGAIELARSIDERAKRDAKSEVATR